MATLLRFLGRSPSAFEVIDGSVPRQNLVEAMALELNPRATDRGNLSLWEIRSEREELYVTASFAVRREHLQRLHLLQVDYSVLDGCEVEVQEDTDDTTFDCVADLHRVAELSVESKRKGLANAILSSLESSDSPTGFKKHTKSEVRSLIGDAYARCRGAKQDPEAAKARAWARALVATSG